MNRKRVLHALNLVIAVGLAALVVVTSKPWEVWRFDAAFLATLLLSLLLDAALVVVWAYRHATVLAAAGSPVRPRDLWSLVTFSNTANNLTPAATGEVLRAVFLNRNFGVPSDRAGAAIVYERVFMFGLMALTAATAGALAVHRLVLAALAGTGVVVYLLALPALVKPWAARRGEPKHGSGRIRRVISGILTGGLQLWSDRRLALRVAGWSVLAFAATASVFFLSAAVSGLRLDPLQTWALVGGATVVGVLSALPFGLGAAELTAVGIGALLGLPTQQVASAFILYRIFFTLPLALAGSYAYARLATAERAPTT